MGTKNTRGYTLIELVVVMAIMAILGTMLITMMNTGTNLYRNANAVMDAQSNARLAMSYITVKIRQNDISKINGNGIYVNGIYVDSTSYRVTILTINDAANPGNAFWIYFDSGSNKLREQYGNNVTGFNDTSLGSGEEIADISSFSTYKYSFDPLGNQIIDNNSGKNIYFEVKSTDVMVDLKQNITLRSQ